MCDYRIARTPIVIRDQPRFSHRGLLVDTGRDYYTPSFIKRIIEVCSWNKLSVFHWHITEVDSFPLELDSVPELAERGAYGPNQKYSKADVADILEHARLMGVRVVPEVDMPGHMESWGLAFPDMVISVGRRHSELAYGIANPASPQLLDVVTRVVNETAGMFDDELFFFGGGAIATTDTAHIQAVARGRCSHTSVQCACR